MRPAPPPSLRFALRVTACAPLITLACASHHDDSASVVVGVQTEEMGGAIGGVHITTTLDGVTKSDETRPVGNGAPAIFPHEVRIEQPTSGGRLAVKIEGFAAGGTPGAAPILVRTAETTLPSGDTRLLRLRLESRCLTNAGVNAVSGPSCTAPQTCIEGRCADDTVLAQDLELYRPGWADDSADICRALDHGAPQVIVGTGQTDYAPIVDGQTLQAELGPQKGHHIWIALRMKNLKQAGSTTTITAVQPGTNVPIPPTAFVFTFDADEGGYCKLYGLRYQLDNGGIDYKQFLGKPLDVTVDVHDTTGADGHGVAHINVAPTVLGE